VEFYACKWLKFGLEPTCQGDWIGKDNFCDSPFPCAAKLSAEIQITEGNCFIEEVRGIKQLRYKCKSIPRGN